jgi:hypothetical protein
MASRTELAKFITTGVIVAAIGSVLGIALVSRHGHVPVLDRFTVVSAATKPVAVPVRKSAFEVRSLNSDQIRCALDRALAEQELKVANRNYSPTGERYFYSLTQFWPPLPDPAAKILNVKFAFRTNIQGLWNLPANRTPNSTSDLSIDFNNSEATFQRGDDGSWHLVLVLIGNDSNFTDARNVNLRVEAAAVCNSAI